MNLKRIVALAWKEWREIVRDRLFFALAFIVPPMLMLVFGFGLTLDVENLPFAVVDHDRTPASRDYAYRFISSRYFDFKGYADDERVIDRQGVCSQRRPYHSREAICSPDAQPGRGSGVLLRLCH